LRIPIAHGEGNYFTTPEELRKLEQNRRIVFRYVSASGAVEDEANPNGSLASIAGICNERRNVVGLMPHPERACELSVGSADGRVIFESVIAAHAAGALTAGSASV
jgi:phosphoribosylformylglycinamidine synthase